MKFLYPARMGRLSKAALLNIELSSICSRNRYTHDPEPVLEELRRVAGRRTDILAEAVGIWAGYFRDDATAELADALFQVEGAAVWVEVGRRRRGAPPHKTP